MDQMALSRFQVLDLEKISLRAYFIANVVGYILFTNAKAYPTGNGPSLRSKLLIDQNGRSDSSTRGENHISRILGEHKRKDGKKVLYAFHLHHVGKVEGVGENIKYTEGQGESYSGKGKVTDKGEEKEKLIDKGNEKEKLIHKGNVEDVITDGGQGIEDISDELLGGDGFSDMGQGSDDIFPEEEGPMEEYNSQADEVPAATENPSMEEITQADDVPPFTQDSQQSEPAHRVNETRAKQLFEGGNVVENVEHENRALLSHFLATNATTSLSPPTQAIQGGVAHMSRGMDFPRANIRAPTPMSFHPKEETMRAHHQVFQ
ncbi:hypothetical protein OROMI_002757 [Orobanche minor]